MLIVDSSSFTSTYTNTELNTVLGRELDPLLLNVPFIGRYFMGFVGYQYCVFVEKHAVESVLVSHGSLSKLQGLFARV